MKAILVIEMPENCNVCDLSNEVHGNHENCLNHDFFITDKDFYVRPSWCPLKPLPQKKEIDKTLEFGGYENCIQEALARGYNACLDEITGETE